MPRRRPRPDDPRSRRGPPAEPLDTDAIRSRLLGPSWAQVDGWRVKQSRQDAKRYRCPACENWVQPGTVHIVAFPDGRPEERRHYHTPCWERQTGTRRPEV